MSDLNAIQAEQVSDALRHLDKMTATTGVEIDSGAWLTLPESGRSVPLDLNKDPDGSKRYSIRLGTF